MPDALQVPELNQVELQKLGTTLFARFETYEKDRKACEDTWLRNLRQFRGIYDPDIAKRIPDDQSTAYPKITRNKVIGTVARLMEMLFPQTEKNYGIAASPLPNLSEADLQKILDQLAVEHQGEALTDEWIEAAIKSVAAAKAERLELVIDDQLTELDYVSICKRVIFSGVLYGIGVLKGPMVLKEDTRKWTQDPYTGAYKATTEERKKPFFELCPVWDWYTDLSAKTLDATDGEFQRHIMTRTQLNELRDRPDFFADQIKKWLADHHTGNYRERHWETELRASRASDRTNVTDMSGRKYEVLEYWGCVTAHEMKAAGIQFSDTELADEVEVNIWLLGNTVIKCVFNPYDGRTRGYHCFVYEEDDINLTGNGLPVTMRDSQLAICEAARMILDNASVVCGPILEMNVSLLSPGQSTDIHARKTFLREDSGIDAQSPAVREINVDSHIGELISVIELFMGFADAETALPPPALGDVSGQGKESLRTSHNMSMLLGAAALPIRDTVRNFDRFTISVISSLIYWNMEFHPDDSVKGDSMPIARGSTSLIAKELRAAALDQFMLTLTPEERIYFKTREVLMERVKARDLPTTIMEESDVVTSKLAEQARNAQAGAQQATDLVRAQIKGEVASAFKDLMLGLKAQAGANVDTFNAIVEGITSVNESNQPPAGARAASGSKPASARAGVGGAG